MSGIKKSNCSNNKKNCPENNHGEHLAVTNFREYLRIPSVQPNINYDECVKFLEKQAESLGLPVTVHSPVPGKPVVIITWTGLEPDQQSILLNSHMDVVPVYAVNGDIDLVVFGNWPPDLLRNKRVYYSLANALGKSHLVKKSSIQVIGFAKVPIVKFEDSRFSISFDVSFNIYEGLSGVVYLKKQLKESLPPRWDSKSQCPVLPNVSEMKIHCPGTPGHGSLLHENTAAEKVNYIMNKFLALREEEKNKLKANKNLTIGDVTTINITMLSGGVQANVLPPEFVVVVDCRVAVDRDLDAFLAMVNAWCKEAGEGTYVEFTAKDSYVTPTQLNENNKWWTVLKQQLAALSSIPKYTLSWKDSISDSRYIRKIGIPAFGFSPMNKTPVLLHDNDEFLNEKTFLHGIDIYHSLIQALANL
ncbi:aminoacylase-1-like [Diaphorina citri]|uniref:Aminoacylase-1-like n=1 Tax=Diaphorina citri TaxID=121845 RepID=A0A3Q0J2E0_DIACI|nr:aminoacylase-1-like [Diaphorina citri]